MKIETKYLKTFNTEAEYEAYKASSNFKIPNSSFVIESNSIHYSALMNYIEPTAKTGLKYNGKEQMLVNPGDATGGTIYYATSNAGASSSTTAPMGTNVGVYQVFWKAVPKGDNSGGTNSWVEITDCAISKANQDAPTAYGASVLQGSTATATASGGGGQGSIEWSNGSTRTAVGSQSTQARWTGNGNYNASSWSNSVTLEVRPTHAGHEYVDLGLPSGTKWATMNIGATATAGTASYGNYYKYGSGATQYSADTSMSYYHGTENPLSMSVDTAKQVWGGQWHIPTSGQCKELIDNTTFTWENDFNGSGVSGGKFTASNGNYVFFPAAGYWYYGSQEGVGAYGYYWSSTPSNTSNAYFLSLIGGSAGMNSNVRYFGFPVRPVVG